MRSIPIELGSQDLIVALLKWRFTGEEGRETATEAGIRCDLSFEVASRSPESATSVIFVTNCGLCRADDGLSQSDLGRRQVADESR